MARNNFTSRVPVQILGTGKLMKGNAKNTGNPYCFQEVCFGFPHTWFDGLRTGFCSIQGADMAAVGCPDGVHVGDTFEAFVNIDQYKNATIVGLISRA